MNKIIISAVAFVSVVLVPVVAMKNSPVRNALSGIFPNKNSAQIEESTHEVREKLDEQQSKIDELQAFKDDQVKSEEEQRKRYEDARIQADLQRPKDKEDEEKAQAAAQCESRKAECASKVSQKKGLISDGKRWIKIRPEADIKNINDEMKKEKAWFEANGNTLPDGYFNNSLKAISLHEKTIKEKEDEIEKVEKELDTLLDGECKDYKKACK